MTETADEILDYIDSRHKTLREEMRKRNADCEERRKLRAIFDELSDLRKHVRSKHK